MTTTSRSLVVSLLAAVLSALLFLAPVGISSAQSDPEPEVPEATAGPDAEELLEALAQRFALSEEEAAEAEVRRDEAAAETAELLGVFLDELDVTEDELAAAGRAVVERVLDDAVAAGDVDAEMADVVLEGYDEAAALGLADLVGQLPLQLFAGHDGPMGGPFGGGPGMGGFGGSGLDDLDLDDLDLDGLDLDDLELPAELEDLLEEHQQD